MKNFAVCSKWRHRQHRVHFKETSIACYLGKNVVELEKYIQDSDTNIKETIVLVDINSHHCQNSKRRNTRNKDSVLSSWKWVWMVRENVVYNYTTQQLQMQHHPFSLLERKGKKGWRKTSFLSFLDLVIFSLAFLQQR